VKTPFTLSQTLKTCLHVLLILLESESESESESLKSESESEFGILHYFFLWKAQECVPPNIGFTIVTINVPKREGVSTE
jgi:hypothetical protein